MPAHSHDHLHRRQGRDAFAWPDPKAIASALAEPFARANPFADPKPAPTQTLVSVVYVTAKPTFEGPIGGYKTLGQEDDDEKPAQQTQAPKKTSAAPEPSATKESNDDKKGSDDDEKTSAETSAPKTKASSPTTLATSTGLPTAISAPSTTLSDTIPLLAATRNPSSSIPSSSSTSDSAESSSTAKPTAEGMSAGGKAGLAIGILLLVGTVLALVLFIFRRKKDQAKKARLADEKSQMFAANGRAPSTRTNATAPRLSLRPVTQFLPNLGEKRASRGNALNTVSESPAQRNVQSQDQNRANPFGNHAEAIDATNAKGPASIQVTSPTGEIAAATVGGAAAGTAVGLARGASKRGNGPKPLDFTTKGGAMAGPPSPAGTEFSNSSDSASTPAPTGTGAAIAAAGGPANSAVHRVQLDFKPSMEDELELRAGQLIRLLHEYDDGWALCIRLDRSQQGVVPRTCLSTRPVKPRPQQQGPRGPPQGQRGPGQMRPMSPAMNGPPRGSPVMNQGPRSASPGGRSSPGPNYKQQQNQRPMTPQGQGRPRSPSVVQQDNRRHSPPGPSRMNPGQANGASPSMGSSPPNNGPVGRKPVPGQAL